MSDIVIKAENIGKLYKLGEIGTGTISHDLNRWWARLRGKEDPFAKIGEANDRTAKGNSDWVWALKDINFEVRKGEVLGIIGRNGAGKSTLLKILSKVTTPSTGKIKTKGRIASLLEVGTGFHQELTGRENIFLNGAILGMRKAEIRSKLDEIIDFAGVERYIDTPVKRYSSGMYVRLAFAVAAFLEPEILIVDEVLAVGDVEFQKKCIGRMKDVSVNDGRTVLFVSHNLSAIQSLCTRGLLMHNGVLNANGAIADIINSYHLLNDNNKEKLKTWNVDSGPANSWCRILSIEIINLSTESLDEITTDDSFEIKIQYTTLQDDSRVGLTVILSDANDNIIFGSINNHEKEYYSKQMSRGQYESRCIVPGSFLNNGRVSLSLILFGPNFSDSIEIKNIINFEVLDGKKVRGDYYGVYGGVVRPQLQWQTNRTK